MEEFINLRQESLSALEYSSKFTKLSKYAPSLVSDPCNEMSCFVTGVSDELKEECHSAMLHDNMNISRLIVHAQQVEETRVKRKIRDAKRARSFDDGSSKDMTELKTSLGVRRGLLINFLPNFPRLVMIGCLNLSLKREKVLAHQARSQLVESVARSTMVSALLGWTIALGVARIATRLGISQI